MQTLIDQMRVMEKVLVEREEEIKYLTSQLYEQNPEASSSSPHAFTSPIGSPAIRSPSHETHLATSPKFSLSHPVR